jgi:hypothetical protein
MTTNVVVLASAAIAGAAVHAARAAHRLLRQDVSSAS